MRTHLFGLCLNVEGLPAGFSLPGLETDALSRADVTVVLGDLGPLASGAQFSHCEPWYTSRQRDQAGTPGLEVRRLPQGHFWWRYHDRTEFLINGTGTEIQASWIETSSFATTLMYVSGAVLGFLLRLRGVISMHGSAIVVGRQAVLITGSEEAGKSTTTAALARRGLAVLTDDIAPLVDGETSFQVNPGPSRVLLLPESVRALWSESESQPPLTPNWTKHCLDLTGPGYKYCRETTPLAVIYVLGRRDDRLTAPAFEQLSGSEGLIELVSNTYANKLLDSQMRAQEFELLQRVLRHVPVRRIRPPNGLDKLGSLCDGILEDCRSLGIS